eukprot:4911250-Amphidinium_carterae.2
MSGNTSWLVNDWVRRQGALGKLVWTRKRKEWSYAPVARGRANRQNGSPLQVALTSVTACHKFKEKQRVVALPLLLFLHDVKKSVCSLTATSTA